MICGHSPEFADKLAILIASIPENKERKITPAKDNAQNLGHEPSLIKRVPIILTHVC